MRETVIFDHTGSTELLRLLGARPSDDSCWRLVQFCRSIDRLDEESASEAMQLFDEHAAEWATCIDRLMDEVAERRARFATDATHLSTAFLGLHFLLFKLRRPWLEALIERFGLLFFDSFE